MYKYLVYVISPTYFSDIRARNGSKLSLTEMSKTRIYTVSNQFRLTRWRMNMGVCSKHLNDCMARACDRSINLWGINPNQNLIAIHMDFSPLNLTNIEVNNNGSQ